MSSRSRLFLRILLAFGVILAISFITSIAIAVRTRNRAEAFLQELTRIRVGQTSAIEVRTLAIKYKRFATDQCNPGDTCFAFDNKWLYPVHLGHPSKWQAGVGVANGRVVDMGFGYVAGITEGTKCSVNLDEFDVRSENPVQIDNRRDGYGRPWKSIVRLSANVNPSERNSLYRVNLSCLSKIGGCKDSQALAPNIWAQE